MADLVRNKSGFTGQPIWKEGSDTGEIVRSITDYVQKTILPPLAPGVPVKVGGQTKYGGTSLQKIIESLKGTPESNLLGEVSRAILP